jgi:hypothetical protein
VQRGFANFRVKITRNWQSPFADFVAIFINNCNWPLPFIAQNRLENVTPTVTVMFIRTLAGGSGRAGSYIVA